MTFDLYPLLRYVFFQVSLARELGIVPGRVVALNSLPASRLEPPARRRVVLYAYCHVIHWGLQFGPVTRPKLVLPPRFRLGGGLII
jgi:hypothetical protein